MRYIVDVSEGRADTINQLVHEGRYKSVGQFIATAIENQMYLEASDESIKSASSTRNADSLIESYHRARKRSSEGARPMTITKRFRDETGYPETTTALNLKLPDNQTLPPTMSMPCFDELVASLSPNGENETWLWGQINKILPVKVGLRILYLLLIDSGESIELEQFRGRAADVVFAFGEMIREYEDKKGKKRDERISAGLPGGDEPFKSKSRYKNHFLAYMRKDGKLDGAMSLLKLVNMHKDTKARLLIGMTEAGSDFARLENPPIDLSDLDHSLSQKEVEFYLKHIQKSVPGEFQAIRWLLKTISSGVTAREEINKKLMGEMGSAWGASHAVIDTQRAGLTSRASELGLIRAFKNGVGLSVRYEVTTEGKAFLS